MTLRLRIVVLVIALMITGCGADGPPDAAPSSTSTATSSASPTVPADLDGCVTAADATMLRDEGASTSADVAIMGDGDVGVVISYETSRYVCTWLPLADRLVDAGYRVLLYDTITGTAVDHVVDRAALLREQGVSEVVLVGGSLGGAASIIASTEIEPPVAAVVSLSGGGIDTAAAAPAITMPLLQVVSESDSPFAATAGQNDAAATRSPAHQLVTIPGRVHASGFFTSPDADRVLTTVIDFIEEHAPAA
jgi:hypothetical protein